MAKKGLEYGTRVGHKKQLVTRNSWGSWGDYQSGQKFLVYDKAGVIKHIKALAINKVELLDL